MGNKKNINFLRELAICAGVMVTVMPALLAYLALKDDYQEGSYIVTAKGANKIKYYPITGTKDLHIMNFDGDTVFAKGGWYPYINVGDTIQGQVRYMNEPTVDSWYYASVRFLTPVTTIQKLNGKGLDDIRKIAHRDSLMREMKQR